jgi:hypothetical protein
MEKVWLGGHALLEDGPNCRWRVPSHVIEGSYLA